MNHLSMNLPSAFGNSGNIIQLFFFPSSTNFESLLFTKKKTYFLLSVLNKFCNSFIVYSIIVLWDLASNGSAFTSSITYITLQIHFHSESFQISPHSLTISRIIKAEKEQLNYCIKIACIFFLFRECIKISITLLYTYELKQQIIK